MIVATALAALATATGSVNATVSPSIAGRDGMVYISVSNLPASAASVKIEGGLASLGKWFGWVALRSTGPSSWRTVLRAPGFFGVYPVEVRAGGHVYHTDTAVRILPRGFNTVPGFFDPAELADWWTRTTAHATLATVSTWQSGFFTHRDPDLNRLLRLRITVAGRQSPRTVFLSIARLRPDGPWRLLEVPEAP